MSSALSSAETITDLSPRLAVNLKGITASSVTSTLHNVPLFFQSHDSGAVSSALKLPFELAVPIGGGPRNDCKASFQSLQTHNQWSSSEPKDRVSAKTVVGINRNVNPRILRVSRTFLELFSKKGVRGAELRSRVLRYYVSFSCLRPP